jgi:hypothetical protein
MIPKNFFALLHTNFGDTKTDRKIVIFESDDWGSIRMPNTATYNTLLNFGIPVNKSVYCKFDTLESNQDLSNLLDILSKVKNDKGESTKFTANFVVANPDFQKIKESKFTEYFFEPINETYRKINSSSNVLKLANEGMKDDIFKPQFHGKEHVNVPLWLQLLHTDDNFKVALEQGLWGLSKDVFPKMTKSVQATYHSRDDSYIKDSVSTGLNVFEDIFGFRSKSFIPNNYIFPSHLTDFLKSQGIDVMQGMKYLLSPDEDDYQLNKIRRNFHRDAYNMTHIVRNCRFEPTELGTKVDQTLKEISMAFLFKKPAVISTHRINFVGGLSVKNRDQNLVDFHFLLKSIVKKWPDVEFLNSDEVTINNNSCD